MSNNTTESMTESLVERMLEDLKVAPARDPLRAASGRARFLREAIEYQQQGIALAGKERQSGWIFPLRVGKFAMNALAVLILAVSLLLGAGVTVAAAQDDLPDQPLYQVKLWTEEAALALNDDPTRQASLLMEMAQTRVDEMAALAEKGVTPPDRVRERLEIHLRQTLRLAAGMDEDDLKGTLLQLREQLQKQDRMMQGMQGHATAGIEPQLTRTRHLLQINLQLAEQGLADPQAFRYAMRNGLQHGTEEEATPGHFRQGEPGSHRPTAQPTGTPGPGNGNGNCDGNGSPCDPKPKDPPNGNCGNGPCGEEPGGHHPEEPKDGHGGGGSDHEKPGGSNGGNGSGGGNGSEGGSGGGNGGGGGGNK